ncbi:MAG: sulfatase-like hydrolase/transferase [Bacteroidales bacterium]|nr:sulfatase-like hydrolase/transferase [Bacteroidales bacterium]
MKIPFQKITSLILLAIILVSSCDRNKAVKPNIILVMADDLGYECLACNGGESYKTPVLDELAATGIRYTSCFSQPLCTPSRVQIMTGKYNNRNYSDFGILPPGETTFGNLLKEAGYETAIVGKWQLFGSKTDMRVYGQGTYPTNAGFDEYCLWQIDKVGSRYADPLIHWNDSVPKVFKNEYGPDVFFRYIDEFLTKKREAPFFLYYPMALPHDPHVPTPDSEEWDSLPNHKDDRFFKDMVEYMDKSLGRIVSRLDELGLRENTILIFTGDNGTNRRIVSIADGKEIKGKKGIPCFYGTHVPLIVNAGNMSNSGVINNDLVDFSDILPTICELAGVELTELETDGISFVGTLNGEKGTREWIYCYYNSGKKRFPFAEFIQDQKYKLYGDNSFISILEDPGEIHPLKTDSLSENEQNHYLRLKSQLEQISK